MPAILRPAAPLLLLLLAGAAHAQVQLHGRIIEDASGHPVPGATVSLLSESRRVLARRVTDELGAFRFRVEGSGPVHLHAERIGLRGTTTPPLRFGGYDVYRVEVRLAVDAVLLAPLEIVARSRSDESPTLSGFERRRESGLGLFVTREEIERRRPNRVTDLLAALPGVWIQRSGANPRGVVYTAREARCPAQLFVDGFHMNRPVPRGPGGRGVSTSDAFPVDDLVLPEAVHGIEVYPGLASVPPEFLTPAAACGVVAIWTRRGG